MEGYDFVDHRANRWRPAFIAIGCADERPGDYDIEWRWAVTNIALLLMHYPECACNIRGSGVDGAVPQERGNFTPNAEFNIAAINPEAAALWCSAAVWRL